MRKSLVMVLNLAALLALAALPAGAQSLADVARQNRMNKSATPASPVYTNDNLPASSALSVTGTAAAEEPSSAAPEKAAAPAKDAKAQAKEKEERDKLEAEWRGRFKKQRDTITLLEREAAALDREIKLRPPGIACATTNLCNDKAAKDQQVQQEKQKLEDMKDELRKAELPDSWAE
jgi:hypothetical protein